MEECACVRERRKGKKQDKSKEQRVLLTVDGHGFLVGWGGVMSVSVSVGVSVCVCGREREREREREKKEEGKRRRVR